MGLIDRRYDSQQERILQWLCCYAVMRWARGKTAHPLLLVSELESLAETAASTYPLSMNERTHRALSSPFVPDTPRLHRPAQFTSILVYQIVERRFA